MEPITRDLVSLGSAAVITLLLLRTIFQFIQKYMQKIEDSSPTTPSDTLGQSIENNQLLKTMSIQVSEMHKTLQVTRDFQRAFTAIVESQQVQTKILKELSDINANSLKVLDYLADELLDKRTSK